MCWFFVPSLSQLLASVAIQDQSLRVSLATARPSLNPVHTTPVTLSKTVPSLPCLPPCLLAFHASTWSNLPPILLSLLFQFILRVPPRGSALTFSLHLQKLPNLPIAYKTKSEWPPSCTPSLPLRLYQLHIFQRQLHPSRLASSLQNLPVPVHPKAEP